jgi:predicted glutamine amidotransferase
MCVILVCPANVRPSKAVLYACHDANPHGAGLAWRENGRVKWEKNIGPGRVMLLLKELPPGEVVVHFRWASVGGVDERLCHPFPVTKRANLSLTGSADTVLFHNGTWGGYADALLRLEEVRKQKLPAAPMSDTRAAALVTHTTGPDVLHKLPGKWVWMNAASTRLFGQWEQWNGMQVSNTHFVSRLARRPSLRPMHTQTADHCRPCHQASLFPMPDEA